MRGGEDDTQHDEERQVRQRGQPLLVEHPQAELQENADDGEGEREAEAQLGQEESISVGLHRQHRERQIYHPKWSQILAKLLLHHRFIIRPVGDLYLVDRNAEDRTMRGRFSFLSFIAINGEFVEFAFCLGEINGQKIISLILHLLGPFP